MPYTLIFVWLDSLREKNDMLKLLFYIIIFPCILTTVLSLKTQVFDLLSGVYKEHEIQKTVGFCEKRDACLQNKKQSVDVADIAFQLSPKDVLFSLSISASNFPREFSILATIRPRKGSTSYLLSIFNHVESIEQLSLVLGDVIRVSLLNYNFTLNFNASVNDGRWHRLAFSIKNNSVTMMLDCHNVQTKTLRHNYSAFSPDVSPNIFIGHPLIDHEKSYDGEIQQLLIVSSPNAIIKQCTYYTPDCNVPLPTEFQFQRNQVDCLKEPETENNTEMNKKKTKGEHGSPEPPCFDIEGRRLEIIKGNKGERGIRGKRGQRGAMGKPGVPGKPGKTGQVGFPGCPGKPGVQGKPGLGLKGEKGEPGLPAPPSSCANEANPIKPCVEVFHTLASLKDYQVSTVGTLAYVTTEEALLIKTEHGWQYIAFGSGLPLSTAPQLKFPVITPYGPTLRMAALNKPIMGDMSGIRAADARCQDQAKRAGFRGKFVAFLSSVDNSLNVIVLYPYRGLPVTNILGEVLINSWKDIFADSGAPFKYYTPIYSFDGRNIMQDDSWPQKIIWHGSTKLGYASKKNHCDSWQSNDEKNVGLASPLNSGKLLDQEKYACNNLFIVLCVEESETTYQQQRRGD